MLKMWIFVEAPEAPEARKGKNDSTISDAMK
jgi:hypothetical protein